jgi:hypothetical protein
MPSMFTKLILPLRGSYTAICLPDAHPGSTESFADTEDLILDHGLTRFIHRVSSRL